MKNRGASAMRGLLAWLLLSGTAGNALAAWEKSEVDLNGGTVYFDPVSIRRHGDIVKVLVLMDSRDAVTVENEQYRSVKANIELECAKNQVRVFFLSVYTDRMGGGRIIRFGKVDDDWQTIEEGSPSVALSALACRKR